MNDRCGNENSARYKDYGGSGYSVCDRWKTLDKFIEDVDKIEGFNEAEIISGNLSLDKDSKDMSNKIYCLE